MKTDRLVIRQPSLKGQPLVLISPVHGKMVITAVNTMVEVQGIDNGTSLTDARTLIPGLLSFNDQPGKAARWLKALGGYCNRFSPSVSLSGSDTVFIDATGCTHLWGGAATYLVAIRSAFAAIGYQVRLALAGTPGAAWALTRYGKDGTIVPPNRQMDALLPLPPAALQLDPELVARLQKLGLKTMAQLLQIPRPALLRRFGQGLLDRIDACSGQRMESWDPVFPPVKYQERLASLEPIITLAGVETALRTLLEKMTKQLKQEGLGARQLVFTGFRSRQKPVTIQIGTHQPVQDSHRLFRLFEMKFDRLSLEPGIESFLLEMPRTEPVQQRQERIWDGSTAADKEDLAERIDRISNKFGAACISRFLPAEHHWPERAYRKADTLFAENPPPWPSVERPILLLPVPETVEVSAPVPDYPPLLFRYKGVVHEISKADGPERIEQEWWLQEGIARDYYIVEDKAGQRYWLFRSGHYQPGSKPDWYLHGYFA
ncbi:MAG: DNA polymerase Y family protein [Flavihumibacter sp.]